MFEYSSKELVIATFSLVCIWHLIEGVIFIIKKKYRKIQISNRHFFGNSISKTFSFQILNFGNYIRIPLCLLGLCYVFFLKDYFLIFKITSCFLLLYQIIYNLMLRVIVETSDRMMILIVLGMVIGLIFNFNLGLLFIAGNVLLAYFFTGYKKLISPLWRNGQALFMVMNTESYGNKHVASFLIKNKPLSLTMSWGIILLQITFPIAVLNESVLITYLVLGFLFHLSIMIIMKLHNFFFSFIAAYPSLIFLLNYFIK